MPRLGVAPDRMHVLVVFARMAESSLLTLRERRSPVLNLLQGIYVVVVVCSLLLSGSAIRREIETAKRESLRLHAEA